MSRPNLALVPPSRSMPGAAWQAVARRVHDWSVQSQLGARRNAMAASTRLAERRAEREDVEDFLRHHTADDETPHSRPERRTTGTAARTREA
ncbi:hypothetical protein [Nocardioides acrostichi]|uniref:Uncharacterized protein n=1 Tax=Nocardioides acrostichi TaxID=2784339 RepID=A0A930Y9H2_9ACTN|nr:hypothetical protein [Nocardioides acrostichi]MBF4160358.1 hypothetical protein [Nocardioides acrostichi]